MDYERFERFMDREIPIEELRTSEKKELKEYAKVLNVFKEKCCYRPSNATKLKTLERVRKFKHRPYKMFATIASFALVGVFSVVFFTNNTVLVKRKGDLYQLSNVLGYNKVLSERLQVNLSTTERSEGEVNTVAMMEREMEKSLGFLNGGTDQSSFEVSGISTTY